MKNRALILFLLISNILILASCSSIDSFRGKNDNNHVLLPEGFSHENIKSATKEYINYQLWVNPIRITGTVSEKSFEPYINQIIDFKVRKYDDMPEKELYIETNIGEWLILLKIKDGIVYGDGRVAKDEPGWPQGKYRVVSNFSVLVEEPHKPNYGSSPRKEKMIVAAEEYLRFVLCEDFAKGTESEKWKGARVYLADFYEYEDGASAWIVRNDGVVSYTPVGFVEKDATIKAGGAKGFEIEAVESLDPNDLARFMYERDTGDAVLQFTCDS